MLDYLFFNEALCQRFEESLKIHQQPYQRQQDEETITIQLDEDLDETLCDQLDELYDQLFDEQAKITANEETEDVNLVAVQYTDANGEVGVVTLQPDLVTRLHQAISLEELQSLVQTVADAVESNDRRSMCQRLADDHS
ncbi:MAG: hypothetical protein Q9N68_04030 [Gammaproteobacteria bacterium]|nr:hypothetical protein [Gammaproteobacteria bacterium]